MSLLRKAILTLKMGNPIPADVWMKLSARGYDMPRLEAKYAL
ncbi:hypothetical protein [Brucella pseudogrignonensis]|nr:hypothetical protein [Brucella pseudogrignonensis]